MAPNINPSGFMDLNLVPESTTEEPKSQTLTSDEAETEALEVEEHSAPSLSSNQDIIETSPIISQNTESNEVGEVNLSSLSLAPQNATNEVKTQEFELADAASHQSEFKVESLISEEAIPHEPKAFKQQIQTAETNLEMTPEISKPSSNKKEDAIEPSTNSQMGPVDTQAHDWSIDPQQDIEKEASQESSSDASFDWSLGNIPGYQTDAETIEPKSPAKKSIFNFFKKSKRSKKSPKYQKILAVLLLIVFLMMVVFYLLDYYQIQQEDSDISVKRYQLSKPTRELSVKKPLVMQNQTQQEKAITKTSDVTDAEVKALLKPDATDGIESIAGQDTNKIPVNESSLSSKITQKSVKSSESSQMVLTKPPKASKLVQPAPKSLPETQPAPSQASNEIHLKVQKSDEVLAYQAYQTGNLQKSEELYLAALSKKPESIASLFGLGAIAMSRGELNKAYSFYKKAEAINPRHPEVKKAIALLSAQSGQYSDQGKVLKNLIAENPRDAKLPYSLGNLFAKKGDWVNAQKQYFKAFELDGRQFDYALNLAVSLDHLGEYELAKQFYKTALSLQKNDNPSAQGIKKRLMTLNTITNSGSTE